jgi:hypothetical protein
MQCPQWRFATAIKANGFKQTVAKLTPTVFARSVIGSPAMSD